MTVGNILTLTPNEIGIMRDAIDDMIANFGKQCNLVFEGKSQVYCVNCVRDTMTGRSRNIYKTGGPQPFGQGNFCPVCGGTGVITAPAQLRPITLICRWNPSDFILLPGNIEVPYSVLETEGWLADLPDVLQSRVLIAELPIVGSLRARFELSGEPVDVNSISEGQTWTAHWKRKG